MFDLAVILLVWRDHPFLRACLDSLAAAQDALRMQVIVVANGVLVGDATCASRPFPIRVIQNEKNRGVACARNQGLRFAQGRYLMLLDVDTRVAPEALAALVSFMETHPEVGLAGPRLQDSEGNLQYTCRKLPTVLSKLLRRVPTRWAEELLADEMLLPYDHRAPRAVDYVIGACQIIRREAFEGVGLLDEQFFYGAEDVDYCLRMWRAGWRVAYAPQAVVTHAEQRLTRRQPVSRLGFHHAAGLARFFWKWRYAFRRPCLEQLPRGAQADAPLRPGI